MFCKFATDPTEVCQKGPSSHLLKIEHQRTRASEMREIYWCIRESLKKKTPRRETKDTVIQATKSPNSSRNIAAKQFENRYWAFFHPRTDLLRIKIKLL